MKNTNPTLFTLIWQDHKTALYQVIILNLINALVSVGVIAFINRFLLSDRFLPVYLPIFFGLIALLLLTTFISQYALTVLGHRFVFKIKTSLVRRLLHTNHQTLEQVGRPTILASLSKDIESITMAFVRLPELVQGVIVCVCAMGYLGSLSLILLLAASVWIFLTIWLSTVLVNQVYTYLKNIRTLDDKLYHYYQSVLEGNKELTLNRYRAKRLYDDFAKTAKAYQHQIIKADTFHLSAVNFSNISLFGSLGLLFGLSYLLELPIALATTFGLTVLFIQAPLLRAVGAYPVWQSAQIALNKINALKLPTVNTFTHQPINQYWQHITLKNIGYRYDDGGFAVNSLNVQIKRGETLFLIGANGSGKTTFAKLITGLVTATQGQIFLDDTLINDKMLPAYQGLFSAILSDFYLFDTLLGKDDDLPDTQLMNDWLNSLQLDTKLTITDCVINNIHLSTGQKKRIALLLAVCEQKDILLLDEWAADQDPHYRHYFYNEILPKLKAMGKTLFIISHDDGYFDKADRLFEMRNGTLTELLGDSKIKASTNAIKHLMNDK